MDLNRLDVPSPEVSKLLNSYFSDAADLSQLSTVQLDLESECDRLQEKLQNARSQAQQATGHGSLQMEAIAANLDTLCNNLQQLNEADAAAPKVELVKELGDLAAEVSRVAEVRAYVEAVLQLERLVGDLEDGVFAAASTTPVGKRGSQTAQAASRLSSAVDTLSSIERLMAEITKSRPQWERLISAVDVRVDRAAAALRPVAISDYRATVVSIGWPPPLSISGGNEQKKTNPLLDMQGELRRRFRDSFVSLSKFQAVQIQRRQRARHIDDYISDIRKYKREGLWSVEELVSPIAEKAEVHFKKWLHKPEFVFALAYKVAQQHVAVVDATLQPMLDEDFLGYSAREEWVSAIVAMVAEHLRRWALPTLLKDFDDDSLTRQVSTVWLHTVDQTLSFDAKMQALVVKGIGLASDEGFSGLTDNVLGVRQPCISVFADRADWLEIWAELELNDVKGKMKLEYENEAGWTLNAASTLTSAEFKAPLSAYKLMTAVWNVIERCRSLPEAGRRLRFVKATAVPLLEGFILELLLRCQEAEATTALADEASMSKVGICLNAARYSESTLKEWCEDLFFLDLRLAELHGDDHPDLSNLSQIEGSVFDLQIRNLSHFRSSWRGKLVSVISRGFDARLRDYIWNKRRWSEEDPFYNFQAAEEAAAPSPSLVEALAVLHSQLTKLKSSLDQSNFVDLWQRLIPNLDQILFQGVVLGGARFSTQGVHQFASDVKSLFMIFRPFCARPASFFSALSDSMKLMTMDQREVADLLWKLRDCDGNEDSAGAELLLKQYGVRNLTAPIAERILSSVLC